MPNFYVLNVGHGNCSVLHDTEGVTVIDTGTKFYLKDFLMKNNISEVGILLLSHADSDHISGAMRLLAVDEIDLKRVFINSDSSKDSRLWDDFVYSMYQYSKENDCTFETSLTPNLNGFLDQGDVHVEILAPNQYIAGKGPGSKDRKGRKLESNSISAVVRLSLNDKPLFLLPGDIDRVGLDNLIEDDKNIQTQVTLFPHHGGKPRTGSISDFTKIFCESVKPEVVIFSIGNNVDKFPNNVVIETIQEDFSEVQMYTTGSSEKFFQHVEKYTSCNHRDNTGTIMFCLDKDSISFEN